jgi:hypothetical protein
MVVLFVVLAGRGCLVLRPFLPQTGRNGKSFKLKPAWAVKIGIMAAKR